MKKLLVVFIFFFILSCEKNSLIFLVENNKYANQKIEALYKKIKSEQSENTRYFVNNQIIQILKSEDKIKLDFYLDHIINKFQNDSYKSYYLTTKAINLEELKNLEIAEIYYTKVVEEFTNLIINNQDIKMLCIEKIINLTNNSAKKIKYLNILLDKIGTSENSEELSKIYYYLATENEKLGNWDISLTFYEKFLKSKFITIPENPNAYSEINKKVNIKYSKSKKWMFENLDDLVENVKYALSTKNQYLLRSLQSEGGFFAGSWTQEEIEAESKFKSGMGDILTRKNIKYKPFLDPISNEQEAYLETWNWEYRINKWYFYFKKIDYPADPEINGKWEWAGIYLGDKHWTPSNE